MVVVKLEECLTQEDIEVLIRYAHMDGRVAKLMELAKLVDSAVKCSHEGNVLWVEASDILYIESVEKRTFVYVKQAVYRTDMRLYQLLELLDGAGFAQVSKFCLVNLYCLASIKTLVNSRMEGTLTSGERITVSRKYIAAIKKKLQER